MRLNFSNDPPVIQCPKCQDWGRVRVDGTWIPCDCEAGQNVNYDFLALLNDRREKKAKVLRVPMTGIPVCQEPLKPITEADFAPILAGRNAGLGDDGAEKA